MTSPLIHPDATSAWIGVINEILGNGRVVAPRGMGTREVPHNSVAFKMNRPAVTHPGRKLSYTFMAAEAMWIMQGDDTVNGISPYCDHIAQFSDDGKTFAGAYGPPIQDQLEYVVKTLVKDRDTRQAVLTLWKPSPPPSKDIPCTITLGFEIRDRQLHAHVVMRSSDAWLGVPYDFFNFSMITAMVGCYYNVDVEESQCVGLGTCYWTAFSSHLYDRNREDAERCAREYHPQLPEFIGETLPPYVQRSQFEKIWDSLVACRDRTCLAEGGWRIRP